MVAKSAFIISSLLACSWALPTPDAEYEPSFFYSGVDPDARIVGGTQAAFGAHPHTVALITGSIARSFFCGASLITRRTVLTAAHCITPVLSGGSLISSVRGVVGTNRWNTGGVLFSFLRHVNHPNYNANNIKNDIGLLITTARLNTNNVIGLIALNTNFIGGGVSATVAGWGRTQTSGSISTNLLELRTLTLTGQRCIDEARRAAQQLNMRAPPVDPNLELCTFHSPGRGNCNGDSGSALVHSFSRNQIGVVTWVFPCARGGPDMYARVSTYINWLRQNMVN